MDIIVTQVKQIGREIILDGNSVVGYQHSANLYVKLIKDPSEDSPFSGMALSAYCRRWNSKMPVACPIVEKDDGTYILLNQEVFKEDGDVYLSLGGISDDKVIVTSNNLVLQVDDSNSIITSVTPTEEYWQIEVLNAIKAWYASVVDPTFTASNNKLNQLIRQTEEHELKAEALQSKAEEQQTQVDTAITNAGMATSAAQEAANNANTKAGEASSAAQAATQAASSANTAAQGASTATTNANNAADAANDIAEEIERRLQAGELKGDPGSRTLYGSGAPLISIGNVGDWYYDTTSENWDVYYKSAESEWTKMGQIKGSLGGDTVPIGAMIPSTTSTIPDGWLLCDGSLVSRTEYSELFAVIGETYGAGDGSATFALPNEPNPLAHTVEEDNTFQFMEREPALYMIIKAKQLIPVTGGIINDAACESETDALSALATKSAIEQSASLLSAKMPNPNLLINGDFQIWQRGEEFETYGYTADRCLSNASLVKAMSIHKVDNGMRFACNKLATLAPYIYLMEDVDLKKVRGKTVTLSYSVDGVIRSFTLNDFGQVFIQDDEILESHTLPSTADGLGSRIIAIQYSNMAVGQSKTINWVKLEYGSFATPYVPRLYAEELALCKRYYQVVNAQSSVAFTNADGKQLIMPISSIPMYKTPTVSGVTLPLTITVRYDGKDANFTATNIIATYYGDDMKISFRGESTSLIKVVCYIVTGISVALNAEVN